MSEPFYKGLEQDYRRSHVASLTMQDDVKYTMATLEGSLTADAFHQTLKKLPSWLDSLREVSVQEVRTRFCKAMELKGQNLQHTADPSDQEDVKELNAFSSFCELANNLLGKELGAEIAKVSNECKKLQKRWEDALAFAQLRESIDFILVDEPVDNKAEDVKGCTTLISALQKVESVVATDSVIANLFNCFRPLLELAVYLCAKAVADSTKNDMGVSVFGSCSHLSRYLEASNAHPDHLAELKKSLEGASSWVRMSTLLVERKDPKTMVMDDVANPEVIEMLSLLQACKANYSAVGKEVADVLASSAQEYIALVAETLLKLVQDEVDAKMKALQQLLHLKDTDKVEAIVWWKSQGKDAPLEAVLDRVRETILKEDFAGKLKTTWKDSTAVRLGSGEDPLEQGAVTPLEGLFVLGRLQLLSHKHRNWKLPQPPGICSLSVCVTEM